MAPVAASLLFHRLPDSLRDHGWIVVDFECHGPLKSLRPRDEDAEPAIERVGSYPCFVRARRVPAASDDGRLNALTADARNALDIEDSERHTEYCSGQRRWGASTPGWRMVGIL